MEFVQLIGPGKQHSSGNRLLVSLLFRGFFFCLVDSSLN